MIVADEMGNLFRGPLVEFARGTGLLSDSTPAWDIYENKENYVVRAELPGLKKEDIGISLEDGQLKITGEHKAAGTPNNGRTVRTERFVGTFERSLALPSEVNPDKITAQYIDGILTVTLPKAEETKPKRIEIKASN
jgi:HSP20 family protein